MKAETMINELYRVLRDKENSRFSTVQTYVHSNQNFSEQIASRKINGHDHEYYVHGYQQDGHIITWYEMRDKTSGRDVGPGSHYDLVSEDDLEGHIDECKSVVADIAYVVDGIGDPELDPPPEMIATAKKAAYARFGENADPVMIDAIAGLTGIARKQGELISKIRNERDVTMIKLRSAERRLADIQGTFAAMVETAGSA